MAKTTSRSNTAQGPAIGSSGAGLGGALRAIAVTPGQFVGTVSVRLRTRILDTPVQPGSVGVEVALVLGGLVGGAAPVSADALDSRPAEWAKFGHVWTGQGCVWHPNVFVNPDAKGQILVRVWNRDDLDATAPIIVDVSVTCSEEPVSGSDTPDPTYSPGTGSVRSFSTANPAAGSDPASKAVPAGLLWRLRGWAGTLVASGTAATRRPRMTYGDGTGTYAQGAPGITNTASQTSLHSGSPCGQFGGASVDGWGTHSEPEMMNLPVAHTVAIVTANLQAGDDWSALRFSFEEWVVPQVAVA